MDSNKNYEYEKDFYAWTKHTAELIRQGKFDEIDAENVAEEIESMGRSNKRELISRLAVLMAHLLKWKYQAERRSKSWMLTLKIQRIEITRLIKQSPSLKYDIESTVEEAYEEAVILAARETLIDESDFSKECPFTLAQCLNTDFLPD